MRKWKTYNTIFYVWNIAHVRVYYGVFVHMQVAFEIQMLSTLAINCQGNVRTFMFASEIHQQKKCKSQQKPFAKSYDFIFEPFQLDEKH